MVLMVTKFLAYFLTGSTVILTDAAESIVNIVGSGFAFYSIYLSSKPRDKNHPYGHGKVEFFAAGVEGVLIFVAGILICVKACFAIVAPQPIKELGLGSILIASTGLVNYILGYILIKNGKKINSLTLEADGKHLQTDAFSSLGVIIGIALIYFTNVLIIDGVLSLMIGGYIIFNGYKLVRKFVAGLMDEADFDLLEKVVAQLNVNRRKEWIDIHNLRVQQYGADIHVDCHVTLPWYFDLQRVHEEVSCIDKMVAKDSEGTVEFFIHADPCLPQCCHYCKVENCPVRTEEYRKEIEWTVDILMENQKHFAV
ncbi:cation diffusion facilitator family transporter [Solitalea canadensis DSM 3403]|uniref:Cation diffusion facilitator family transporter n=1 Tax=Solitalea canadensis (strain ATCC 29591 / DSM 3403 / JCM 21819 / LMG 8368 / NBRC 15130 / NCIMB 12057 / USAM 9D) TaxID=929556 RepID=H8KQZ8_SOLCM|nr:cation diffusion facilitator family transporter [Solitalea canadensis DSM 3403]